MHFKREDTGTIEVRGCGMRLCASEIYIVRPRMSTKMHLSDRDLAGSKETDSLVDYSGDSKTNRLIKIEQTFSPTCTFLARNGEISHH